MFRSHLFGVFKEAFVSEPTLFAAHCPRVVRASEEDGCIRSRALEGTQKEKNLAATYTLVGIIPEKDVAERRHERKMLRKSSFETGKKEAIFKFPLRRGLISNKASFLIAFRRYMQQISHLLSIRNPSPDGIAVASCTKTKEKPKAVYLLRHFGPYQCISRIVSDLAHISTGVSAKTL